MTFIMIDASPKSNTGKRRLDTLDLACPGTKRGKVFSHYPSVANHRIQRPGSIDYRPNASPKNTDVLPTAADYLNLVFCSSDEEEDETIDVDACANKRRKDEKKRRVSFGAFIPIIHYLHDTPLASDMTLEEKSNVWLNSKEIEEMKVSANTTIQEMRELVVEYHRTEKKTTFRGLMGTLEKDKNSSLRGLEHRVFRRKVSRQVIVEEVLECQKHVHGLAKFGHDISSEEEVNLLANVSSKRSVSATHIALLNAKHDALEVGHEARTTTVL